MKEGISKTFFITEGVVAATKSEASKEVIFGTVL
jgi:hypothetical protein